jgi:hypothetical protein
LASDELEGNTLAVYAFVVKEGKPVGTRDVTRGANLSSSSVAFRQLQKLESLGLLQRNAYGNYVVKEKTDINGYVWIGRDLIPRLMFYSLFFMGAFSAEVAIIFLGYFFIGLVIEISFFFLTIMTAVAMVLFFIEGVKLYRKIKPNNPKNYNENNPE